MLPSSHRPQGSLVTPDSAGLQVVPETDNKIFLPPYNEAPELFQGAYGKEAVAQPTVTVEKELAERKPPFWRRKRVWIPVALVVIAVIVGAIIGGVIGSRGSSKEGSSSSSTEGEPSSSSTEGRPASTSTNSNAPTTSTTNAEPSPSSIKPRSKLSAVSLRNDDSNENTIFLTYQGTNGDFQIARYIQSGDEDDGSWDNPQPVELDHTPKDLSGLALCLIYLKSAVWLDLTFVNASRNMPQMISETNARHLEFEQSRGYNMSMTVAFESNLAAYGGWLVYQEANGELAIRVRYPSRGVWRFNALSEGGVEALDGTSLAIVPLSTNHTRVLEEGAVGVVYQTRNERLAATIYSQQRGAGEAPDSWPSLFPDIDLPRGGSFAAFSVQRSDDADIDLVNTYILYQDKSRDIKQLWTEDGNEWKTSSPAVLKAADSGTSIACTTLGAVDVEGSRRLGPASEFTRCYYRKDGHVVEVQFDGSDWVDLGSVSIP
ncbi:hypothetical protein HJFPF1_11985 [Paramyrothecium foliicola]|nr:hypothetical protein HJFPF1_11985 [Paramyrothecium foliicola]